MLSRGMLFLVPFLAIAWMPATGRMALGDELRLLLDLKGEWKFELGDSARWAGAAYDDSRWSEISGEDAELDETSGSKGSSEARPQ